MKENPEDAKQGKEEEREMETSFTQVALPKYFFYVIIRSNRLTTNKEKDSSLSKYRG
jgi:hypothetical protein